MASSKWYPVSCVRSSPLALLSAVNTLVPLRANLLFECISVPDNCDRIPLRIYARVLGEFLLPILNANELVKHKHKRTCNRLYVIIEIGIRLFLVVTVCWKRQTRRLKVLFHRFIVSSFHCLIDAPSE